MFELLQRIKNKFLSDNFDLVIDIQADDYFFKHIINAETEDEVLGVVIQNEDGREFETLVTEYLKGL